MRGICKMVTHSFIAELVLVVVEEQRRAMPFIHLIGYCTLSQIHTVIVSCSSSCSIALQSPHHPRHLLITVDAEPLFLGDARELHVLGVQLLLHHLLESLQDQHFGFGQGERLVELVLQLGLGTLTAGTNGFGVVSVERA